MPHLTRNCKKTPDTDATCCHYQGNHLANYSGCPKNPLNKTPTPPKVNFWEEYSEVLKEYESQGIIERVLQTEKLMRTWKGEGLEIHYILVTRKTFPKSLYQRFKGYYGVSSTTISQLM
ncbi:hypothetical protein TNCT_568531 [Trichonephila clavata]|uniref:Uncharacterized protein n=1 Tax=Trichonephila clavata TaxID=2740835 RepID=A0A8X6KCW0_TRICU|nr:hypothetical protein TNCT_568531 [Trichonephila clavata]